MSDNSLWLPGGTEELCCPYSKPLFIPLNSSTGASAHQTQQQCQRALRQLEGMQSNKHCTSELSSDVVLVLPGKELISPLIPGTNLCFECSVKMKSVTH